MQVVLETGPAVISTESYSRRCVARDTGEPVFGLETDVTAAQDMTCACATQVNIGQIAVAERGRV